MQSVSRSKVLKVEEREEVVRRRRIEYSIVARTERAEVTVAVETHTPRLKLEGSSLIVSSCTYENHASFPRYITGRARARASVASVRGETFRSISKRCAGTVRGRGDMSMYRKTLWLSPARSCIERFFREITESSVTPFRRDGALMAWK